MAKRRPKLETCNPHITCYVCKGYLIEATAITECLHTFCKSCIIKHLEESNLCPQCNVLVHRSHPLQHIRADHRLQDIVHKIVPRLAEREKQRENLFYIEHGIPYPKELPRSPSDNHFNPIICRRKLEKDEKVCIQLENKDSAFEEMSLKFVICSSNTTIQHLKKLIAKKVLCDLNKYCDIDIMCKEEVLGKDHTLKFIYVTLWRFEEPPLKLYYVQKNDYLKEEND